MEIITLSHHQIITLKMNFRRKSNHFWHWNEFIYPLARFGFFSR